MTEKCENCRYFKITTAHTQGDCRRNAPRTIGRDIMWSGGGSGGQETRREAFTEYPMTTPADWCGEWKEK